jgi:heme-degrading monooxygenase HmoA
VREWKNEGGGGMIARHWRGWTKPDNADGYEKFLKQKVLPRLRAIGGYRGGYILRKDGDESEFVVINLFESLDAVKRFAGPDYTVAVFEPEAKKFLSRIENFATHYEVRAVPDEPGANS